MNILSTKNLRMGLQEMVGKLKCETEGKKLVNDVSLFRQLNEGFFKNNICLNLSQIDYILTDKGEGSILDKSNLNQDFAFLCFVNSQKKDILEWVFWRQLCQNNLAMDQLQVVHMSAGKINGNIKKKKKVEVNE